jgi:hypothetical protein
MFAYYSTLKYDQLCDNKRADFIRLLLSKTTLLDIDELLPSDAVAEKYYYGRKLAQSTLPLIKGSLDNTLFSDFLNSISVKSKDMFVEELTQVMRSSAEDIELSQTDPDVYVWNEFCKSLNDDSSEDLLNDEDDKPQDKKALSELDKNDTLALIDTYTDMDKLRKLLLRYFSGDYDTDVLLYGIRAMAARNNAELRKLLVAYLQGNYSKDIIIKSIEIMSENNNAELRKLLMVISDEEHGHEFLKLGIKAVGDHNNAELRKLCISLIESGFIADEVFSDAIILLANNNQTELYKVMVALYDEDMEIFDHYHKDLQLVRNKTVRARLKQYLNQAVTAQKT